MKLPSTYRNPISLFGTIISIIAFITFVYLFVLGHVLNFGSVYLDIFVFIVVPSFLVCGLIMISIGMFLKWRRNRKGTKFPEIDLNEKRQRNAFIIFVVVSIFFIILTIIGSTEAIKYSESVGFCGQTCHAMTPEYTAYQNSAHASVACAECHVGEGTDYFIRAKISGMRQLYKSTIGSYETPIPTPLTNLRPAAQTCERCHWPQKFYTNRMRNEKYYLSDSANTEWNVILNMKIGASHQALGNTEGIHWHINPDIEIQYKSDLKRNNIYWIKKTNKKTGAAIIYKDDEVKVNYDSLNKAESRNMDCMDCHNRPSHEFMTPSKYVNYLFASKKIPVSIPWLKSASMDALKVPYNKTDAAIEGIKSSILGFYKEKYPKVYKKSYQEVSNAIAEIERLYLLNTFPEMNVNFSKFPRHIGHLETNGCFRCHNGRYKSSTGVVISKDCNLCHTIIGQGKQDSIKYSGVNSSLEFIHPIDIGEAWKDMNCMDCHNEWYIEKDKKK